MLYFLIAFGAFLVVMAIGFFLDARQEEANE
jgi:hypothetical protein